MVFTAIGGAAIVASYLDAKYGIMSDIKTILSKNARAKVLPQIMELGKQGYASGYLLVEDAARRWPNKEALVFQNRSWTFAQCEQGLRNESLKYALDSCKPKLVVASEDLVSPITEINSIEIPIVEFRFSNKASKDNDENNITYNKINDNVFNINLNATTTRTKRLFLNELPKSDLNKFVRPKIKLLDIMCHIYTSGTSGFPKIVEFSHLPFIYLKFVAPMREGFFFDDRRYSPLPLYHTSALALALCSCWGVGATFIVGKKFSASKFWEECRRTNATSFQYIGEICRYLMLQPPSINDKNHKVRLIYGNGLRSDIWQAFRERFGIEIIMEFYGQTEGATIIENKNYGLFGLGAVARKGPLLNSLDKSYVIVKFDFEKRAPYRDPKTGRCVLAKINEPGEMIYQVDPNISRGYLNVPPREDPRNLLDVFKKGDFWRRMEDLLAVDKDGWYYFVDRISNSFRWKGENIASQEVEIHLSAYPHIIETTVYGLPLKVYEGQAGMAALILNRQNKDSIQKTMRELPQFLVERGLPKPAIPRFIRLIDE
ncbi:1923_t:CDS:10 [Ambispora leptoticha]|uniref:1923_t:CDS:1 n=1 Tax=Ambispora leptoticha TaxID=144679 RepID=A0A9N8V2T2_9GLOM|nr:1923_t:CDS:10 [Ambispora leptoticha]